LRAVQNRFERAHFFRHGTGRGSGREARLFVPLNIDLADAGERAGKVCQQVLFNDLRDALVRVRVFRAVSAQIGSAEAGEAGGDVVGGVLGERKLTTFSPDDFADFGFAQVVDAPEALGAGDAGLAPVDLPVFDLPLGTPPVPCHCASTS